MTLVVAAISATHVLIAIAIAILLFAAPKLPQMARSMGQSMRIFKDETRKMKEEDEAAKADKSSSKKPLEGSVVENSVTEEATQTAREAK